MLIKEAVYKEVQTTKREIVSDEVHGCDECGEEIVEYPNEDMRLEVKAYHNDSDKERESLHFCSWDCALKHLPKVDSDYFVDLPFLYYDAPEGSKRSANRLIEILRNSGLASEI